MPSLPGQQQFPLGVPKRFQGSESRSYPLPTGRSLSQFGTVFHDSHQQAVAKFLKNWPRLSWLNYSRPGFRLGPRVVSSVGKPHGFQAPHAGMRCTRRFRVPCPAGGFGSTSSRSCWSRLLFASTDELWEPLKALCLSGDQHDRRRLLLPHLLPCSRPSGISPEGLSRSSRLRGRILSMG